MITVKSSLSVLFFVGVLVQSVESSSQPQIAGLTLMNADTDEPIPAFDPLKDGAVLDFSKLPTANLNIRANTHPETIGSVVFALDENRRYRVESETPYSLNGDQYKDYLAWTPSPGKHILIATPFSLKHGQGESGKPFQITFTVMGSPAFTAHPKPDREAFFVEEEGLIVGEIESCPPTSAWRAEMSQPGFSGGFYYTWKGPNLPRTPGHGVLTYRLHISRPGKYNLRIHNRRDTTDSAKETGVWTQMDDGEWIKAYSKVGGKWRWSTYHEQGAGKKVPACYELTMGEHFLRLSGRSYGFSIDRFHMYREDRAKAQDTGIQETRPTKPVGRTATPRTTERARKPRITGELKVWHKITLTFDGPRTWETAIPNPFTDYRLDVTFSKGSNRYTVPGYYAADGNAAHSGATHGNKWRVHFVADEPGQWEYEGSFRTGKNIAISSDSSAGRAVAFDGVRGSFTVAHTDKRGRDHRAKGFLKYAGERYLRFSGTGEYFLKGGADSPENFLACVDFDDTFDTEGLHREGEATGGKFLHTYAPHAGDWQEGDPTWKDGKGKNIIGALNYLACEGMNSVYLITYNIDGGDGKDVWPWTGPGERLRFDCSKLDQWEIVFSHMQRLGLMVHIITQEQENDQGLDRGELGITRKLYYRELIARFAHKLALIWNLGEENTNTTEQQKAFCRYFKHIDTYKHPIVCHTFPGRYDNVYRPLLGYKYFDGASLQTTDTHNQTVKWIDLSAQSGRQWVVSLDEIGPADTGVKPDKDDYWHDEVRQKHLYGNLMAGGAGVEWYFGYKFAHNDLNCEDWRSRDHMWDLTRYALEFFNKYLPFAEMSHNDELTSAKDDYCFAQPGRVYAIYLPRGGTTKLDPGQFSKKFSVEWFNPRTGGELKAGSVRFVEAPGWVSIGLPPSDTNKDWVVLVKSRQD
ncbi:DUF5060 domain-containing protein [bacterium]|nr:DUF5060 domain-containing protein [bacterium]